MVLLMITRQTFICLQLHAILRISSTRLLCLQFYLLVVHILVRILVNHYVHLDLECKGAFAPVRHHKRDPLATRQTVVRVSCIIQERIILCRRGDYYVNAYGSNHMIIWPGHCMASQLFPVIPARELYRRTYGEGDTVREPRLETQVRDYNTRTRG